MGECFLKRYNKELFSLDTRYTVLSITSTTGISPTLYIDKDDSSTLSIDWGDHSNITTNSDSGELEINHSYGSAGEYEIKLWISEGDGNFTLGYEGHNAWGDTVFNAVISNINSGYSGILKSIIVGDYAKIGNTSFFQNIDLQSIYYVSQDISSVGDHNTYWSCNSLNKIVLHTTTPPVIPSNIFNSLLNEEFKIYVPDDNIDNYKTATDWTVYENYIYPIGEMEGGE